MGYYQILKGRYVTHFNPEADYSYYQWWWNNEKTLGFELYLKAINTNQLFLLRTSYYVLNKFDWEKEFRQSTFGFIKLQEINKGILDSIERYLIPRDNDVIFILDSNEDCGDISNYLFSVTKYGKPDDYYYKGWLHIHEEQWTGVKKQLKTRKL